MIKGFIILLQFMTRIPVPVKVEYDEEKLGKAVKFFPLVGLIIRAFSVCSKLSCRKGY